MHWQRLTAMTTRFRFFKCFFLTRSPQSFSVDWIARSFPRNDRHVRSCPPPHLHDVAGTMANDGRSTRVGVSAKCRDSVACVLVLLVVLPLTLFAGYKIAGANPRDQFDLSMETTRIDLDAQEQPTAYFTLTNRSGQAVFLEQLDADYGCRIAMRPSQTDVKIPDGESLRFSAALEVDHAFLVPRIREKTVVPVSVRPIIHDSNRNGFALPPYYFEQLFVNRIVATSDQIRLASHPAPNDAIGSVRSLILTPVGNAEVTSIELAPPTHPAMPRLSLHTQRRDDAKIVVRVEVTPGGTTEPAVEGEFDSELILVTQNRRSGDSQSKISIPIHIRSSWAS